MKKGITVSLIATFIAVMIILATTITISANKSISNAKLRSFVTELSLIQDKIKQKMKQGTDASYLSDVIIMDLSGLSEKQGSSIESKQFYNEEINETEKKIQLYKVDLDALEIYNTKYGKEVTSLDIYALSEKTGKVYYVEGIKANGTTYYTLSEELNIMIGNKPLNINQTEQIKFLPSDIYWTNKAITTEVIYPTTWTDTDITVSAISDSDEIIDCGNPRSYKDGYNAIKVNKEEIVGNYTITINYTKNGTSKTETFNVENYDNTPPVISEVNQAYVKTKDYLKAYIKDIFATDSQSGVKVIKYESEDLTNINFPEEEEDKLKRIKEYFSSYGSTLEDDKILIDNTATKYTIYAEDNAGNVSFKKVEISEKIINAR